MGRQNIAEGSRASATSSQTELRLHNVACASLAELLLDYEDYLRHRRHAQWALDSPEALAVRHVPREFKKDQADLTDLTDRQRWEFYARWLDHDDPAVRANALICLINQAMIRQIGCQTVRSAESPWSCERHRTERTPAHSSGGARRIRNAGAR